ncbi:hypothetical protein [Neisseria montereyensis]|uniref:Periplasmic protein n=1 Tax=Neisseria montereyensis TaxID=2973938 RepID=A0ABT2F9Y4_9NEIS|nr:hypothetical protein [Neisseria montereyensis]MCS4532943.1 hypothetical protein [Neisseria montereyensis]
MRMKKLMTIGTLLLLNLPGIQTASAKIYTCVVNGEVIYTSRNAGNCTTADLPPIGNYSSSRYDEPQNYTRKAAQEPKKQQVAKARKPKVRRATAAPVKFSPPSGSSMPKTPSRNSRRSILEQELANERKALAQAQQSLSSARTAKNGSINQQQIAQLQGNVLDRQQNIQALQRELGRM